MTGVNKSKKDDDTTASYSTWLNEIDPMMTKKTGLTVILFSISLNGYVLNLGKSYMPSYST